MGKANIYIIAREAGVSVATVSRVFNRSSVVKESTCKKVLEVCRRYNYQPSRVASAITTKKTKSVGIIVPSLKEPPFIELIGGAEYILYKNGYCLSVFNARQNIERQLEIANIIDNRIIDGVIFSGVYGRDKDKIFISEMLKRNIPCIMVDRIIPDIDIPLVGSNEYLGGKIAAQFLLECGHRKIGIVTYDREVYIFNQRVAGFLSVLKEKGLKEQFIMEVPLEFSKVEEAIKGYKDELVGNDSTAVFGTSDSIAIFLISLFLENRLKVPDDISVMGYDNMTYSRLIFPRLTTIHHDMFELGKVVATNLLYRLEHGSYLNDKQIIDPKICIRDSVKKI
ncbi:MAG: LacI family DNA-binding transcriptional regulator [Actinomycetota bacterium]